MVRVLVLIVVVTSMLTVKAQAIVSDSASTGSENSLMTFYNLKTGTKTMTANNDWHLAVSVRPSQFPNNTLQGTTLRINEAFGTKVFELPGFTADSFLVPIDTVGVHIWVRLFDSDSALDEGALNTGRNISVFNYGWGVYSGPPKHNVEGNKVYLFQLPNRALKKFLVRELDRDTAWNIMIANIDNSEQQDMHISKKDYAGKNFVYLNLLTNAVIDKEPLSADWDLQFLKYAATDVVPSNTSPVVGVWSNKGVEVAKRSSVPVTDDNYIGLSFSSAMNTIGWNWKFPINNIQYISGKNLEEIENYYGVRDSLSYFVETLSGEVYKLVFTAYEGSNTGLIHFQTKLVSPTGVSETGEDALLSIYPNPTNTMLHVLLPDDQALLRIYDTFGRLVLENNSESHLSTLDVSSLSKGTYLLSVTTAERKSVQRFIVN